MCIVEKFMYSGDLFMYSGDSFKLNINTSKIVNT